ncbi:hypothetical protein K466DRAFT_664486 [Polyporus arcularius HHB13444]|uniref:Uncharacterized protein n=1 Tax=Polyporus arcularius HHB13444 TaxID=1314778 RepID=A0A5C3PB73_9APHY|nr:hypothetical protein K466DRAFT_664486 [Polyporus arcularius HHB13444]
MSATLIIDDSDPAVHYNPAWARAGGPGYGQAYNLTLHRATEVEQSVTVVFRGTGIQVVTMRQPSSLAGYPVTSYYLNGTYITDVDTPFVADGGPSQANVTVFAKRDLTFGTHTLNIVNVNGTRPSTFWLDYFLVDISPTAPVGTTSSPSSSTSLSTGTSLASSATPLSRHIPAIVGGVAGALLVIVAAVLASLWRRRHRRARREKMMRANVQPYVPVVRFVSQYRASLHSLNKVPPSLAAGTQSPSVSTSDVRTSAAEPARGPRERTGGSHLFSQTPRSKPERDIGLAYTPSDADVPPFPALLRQADSPGQTSPTTAAATVPQSPASGLVLPDELGRALSDAPPEVRSSVMSFVHTLFLQGGQRPLGGGVAGEVDSGVRMYEDEYTPPPQYTTR